MTERTGEPVLPCLVKVDGPLGSGVLIRGATYKVVEVREHWEPTGVEGEPPHVTTVIRFDPLTPSLPVPSGLDVERLAKAIHADAESLESDPTDWGECPEKAEHREYAKAIASEYAHLAHPVEGSTESGEER